MVHVCSIEIVVSFLRIHFTPRLVRISWTNVPLLYEQNAINGYVLQLAAKLKLDDLFTQKPMWSAPFQIPAYKKTSFSTHYVFRMISLHMCFHQFFDRLNLSKVHVNSKLLCLLSVCIRQSYETIKNNKPNIVLWYLTGLKLAAAIAAEFRIGAGHLKNHKFAYICVALMV